MDSLPNQFDVIVIGTGFIESTVSAAASRIGKQVLHIDSRDHYGGNWASFNLEAIQQLGNKSDAKTLDSSGVEVGSNKKVVQLGNSAFSIKDVSQTWHIPEKSNEVEDKKECGSSETTQADEETSNSQIEKALESTEEPSSSSVTSAPLHGDESKSADCKVEEATTTAEECKKQWTQQDLLKVSRKFNLDLAPKIQFAKGDLVELLISSNVARYSEFISVSRVLTYINGELQSVPCSRSDIFANSKVNVVSKRMLMKLLTTIMDSDEKEFQDYQNKTYRTFLTDRKLSPDLVQYILNGIAMCTNETGCFEGIQKTKRFLNSLGRYGKTPFLFSLYGSGEMPQAFCRMSAVFGGVYALNQPLHSLCFREDDTFESIICGDQVISANHLVIGNEYIPECYLKDVGSSYISRAIFITDRSILPSEREHLSLLLFPSEDGKNLCFVIEAGSLTGTCPKDFHVVYLFMEQINNPESDLKYFTEKLFANTADLNVLWSFFYTSPNGTKQDVKQNMYPCPGPDIDLDYDSSIKIARDIFNGLYPGEEMLPRAPDPEEIIFGDDTDNTDVDETTDIQEMASQLEDTALDDEGTSEKIDEGGDKL